MKLRIRCPSCRTVLNVPLGAQPVCPACGFGAAGDPMPPQPAGDPQGWEPEPAPEGWQPEQEPAWAEGEEAPAGWGEPAAPKKRGLFGRKKR